MVRGHTLMYSHSFTHDSHLLPQDGRTPRLLWTLLCHILNPDSCLILFCHCRAQWRQGWLSPCGPAQLDAEIHAAAQTFCLWSQHFPSEPSCLLLTSPGGKRKLGFILWGPITDWYPHFIKRSTPANPQTFSLWFVSNHHTHAPVHSYVKGAECTYFSQREILILKLTFSRCCHTSE